MAGTQITTVASSELSIPFGATYTSASLNQKLRGFPRGIVRGFRPVPTGNNDEISLELDRVSQDSVIHAVGILPANSYTVTYRTTSVVTLNLQSLAAARYYIAFIPNIQLGVRPVVNGERIPKLSLRLGILIMMAVFLFVRRSQQETRELYRLLISCSEERVRQQTSRS